jgi:mRNA interferase RelE/StbE
MKTTLSPRAEKQLKKMQKITQIVIAKTIRDIGDEASLTTEKLKGYKNIHRVRVGNFRIVYKKTGKEIYIITIGHRKDIYQSMKKIFGK